MRLLLAIVLGILVAGASGPAEAGKRKKKPSKASCLRALDRLGVKYERVKRKYLKIGVRVKSDLGGVTYRNYHRKRSLILDCSLAVSLAEAGRFLRGHGIDKATYSSAYHIRKLAGSKKQSKHSYGLAIDVHELSGDGIGALRVKEHYEQGLGDKIDCIGQPLTRGGAIMRAVACQMRRSGLFRFILDPDYDGSHYNHFHIEARAWSERSDFAVTGRSPESTSDGS